MNPSSLLKSRNGPDFVGVTAFEEPIAFVLNIAKGHSLPQHTHFDCTVLLYVLTGKADLHVDGQSVPLKANDWVQLDGPENMSVDNTGSETLRLYVTISPAPPSDAYSKNADL